MVTILVNAGLVSEVLRELGKTVHTWKAEE